MYLEWLNYLVDHSRLFNMYKLILSKKKKKTCINFERNRERTQIINSTQLTNGSNAPMVGVVKEGSFIIENFFQHSFIFIIITIIVQISTWKILVLLLCAQLTHVGSCGWWRCDGPLHQPKLATWVNCAQSCTQSSGTKTTHIYITINWSTH